MGKRKKVESTVTECNDDIDGEIYGATLSVLVVLRMFFWSQCPEQS